MARQGYLRTAVGCDSGYVCGVDMTPLEAFEKAGMNASYHYADDSGKEWRLGRDEQSKAEEIFAANPELQEQMKAIATKFLWSMK